MAAQAIDNRGQRLLIASIAISVVLFAVFTATYFAAPSELAIAQAADSIADALTGLALLFALRVSRQPADENHPFGHQAAQPAAALVVAVLVTVLGGEVVLGAIESIRVGREGQLGWPLALAIAVKVAIKLVLIRFARRVDSQASSAMDAFATDARSDAVLGILSVLGFVVATQIDVASFDAWIAVPIGVWIAGSGLMLARESIRLLMGTAAPEARQGELETLVRKWSGVRAVGRLRVRHHGTELAVWVEIFVDPELSIDLAHDLGESLERRLLEEVDVAEAVVHVDADRASRR